MLNAACELMQYPAADGGAIVMRGSSSSLKVDSSFFVDNKQHELLGSAISQELCNPSQISASGNALWQSPETLKASTGCQPIQTVRRIFVPRRARTHFARSAPNTDACQLNTVWLKAPMS